MGASSGRRDTNFDWHDEDDLLGLKSYIYSRRRLGCLLGAFFAAMYFYSISLWLRTRTTIRAGLFWKVA